MSGYTLKSRPEITLTSIEMWEVVQYHEALQGLDILSCWLENEAPDLREEEPSLIPMIEYATEHQKDIELGSEIWNRYYEIISYDMYLEESHAVEACLQEKIHDLI